MKSISLILLLVLSIATCTFGQNKTMAVGTTAANPNAALHIESPTNNQGMILPRLTTAQRTAITLAAADKGLMVFDTDLNAIYFWNGAAWKSSLEAKITYPYQDSVANATGTVNLFTLKYNNAENKRVMRLESLNPSNGSSTLSVYQGGLGLAGFFQVNNPASGNTALYGQTNSDVGGAIAPVGVYGESTGTGSLGGAFWNTNAANTFPALYSRTLGTGNAASFEIVNALEFSTRFAPGHQWHRQCPANHRKNSGWPVYW